MEEDFTDKIKTCEKLTNDIKKLSTDMVTEQLSKMKERVHKVVDAQSFDPERLEMELAIISDKIDINEELSRLGSHIKLFNETIGKNEPVGQKLNFLVQEMHREANTIASKSCLSEISHKAVELKEMIEKIREQVQNSE